MNAGLKAKGAAAGAVLLALVLAPAPLLPPHRLAELLEFALGLGWKAAYLVAAAGLRVSFYGAIGLLASFAVKRAPTLRGRLLQMLGVPLAVVTLAVVIRSIRLGHLPVWAHLVLPAGACIAGVVLGLGFRWREWKAPVAIAVVMIAGALSFFLGGAPAALGRATEANLRRLVAAGPGLPAGEPRFGALLQVAFAPPAAGASGGGAVGQNRAAILALGIAIGHERLAKLAGLRPDDELVRKAAELRSGVTLRGREDWPRHYLLSAALAVLENPLASEAGGLVKEELDTLARGSGFSFGDLAADRAGVRFAAVATRSEESAKGLQARLQREFAVDDFFPAASDLPENLTTEQFRAQFGGVGSRAWQHTIHEIEARLDQCVALSPAAASRR